MKLYHYDSTNLIGIQNSQNENIQKTIKRTS
jgi:hypothetical protein